MSSSIRPKEKTERATPGADISSQDWYSLGTVAGTRPAIYLVMGTAKGLPCGAERTATGSVGSTFLLLGDKSVAVATQ